ncbi:MAG: FlgO family outer membrane protein [Geobacteraceae bacterium]|nr:FlgO family outer membrane protein [Geobacteraceae bacterium]
MRKTALFFVFFLAILQCATVAGAAEFKKTKVAIVDFQENGAFDVKDVGKIVAEWFTTALVNTGRFDVIERRLLQQILEEQKMGVTGLIDPRSASRLGKLLGVKTVVSGTVQSYEGISEINVRLLNVETGSIITAESFKGGSTSSLNKLVNEAAAKIIRHFPLQGYVVKRSGSKVTVDLGGNAGVRTGMQFKVYTEGAPLKHPKTGEVLSVETVEKGTVRITALRDNTSDSVVVNEVCPSCIKAGQLVSAMLLEDENEIPPSAAESVSVDVPKTARESRPKQREELKRPEVEMPSVESNVTPERQTVTTAAVAGAYRTLSAHDADVTAISVSKNGQLAASADKDGRIDIWDTTTWTALATLGDPADTKSVSALAFSSDSKLLAAAGKSDRVVIWDLASRQRAYTMELKETVTSLAFYPAGGSIVIGTKDSSIAIWNYRNNRIRLIKTDNDVLAVAVSPDGKLIASGGQDKNVTTWDANNGARRHNMTGHSNDVTALLFSPGGKQIISAGTDKKIIIWEAKSGARKQELTGHDDDIVALGISKDGLRLVSSESKRGGGMLFVWDLRSGQEQKRIKLSRKAYSMALTPDGRHALTGTDKQVLVYAIE